MNKLNHLGARLIPLHLVVIIQSIASISIIGCDDSPTQHQVNLELSAVDAHNQPLDDVTLLVNGIELNFTQDGYLRDSFPLSDGSPAHVELQAPEGYKLINPQEAVTPLSAAGSEVLTSVAFDLIIEPGSASIIEKRVIAQFALLRREYLLVIEGDPGSEIIINDQEFEEIDASGRSMVFYSGEPDSIASVRVGGRIYNLTFPRHAESYLITEDTQRVISDNHAYVVTTHTVDPAPSLKPKAKSKVKIRPKTRTHTEVRVKHQVQTKNRPNIEAQPKSNTETKTRAEAKVRTKIKIDKIKTDLATKLEPSPESPQLSRAQVKTRLGEIEARYQLNRRLLAQDIEFLRSLTPATGISYYYANRLLGLYYYSLKDYRRQRDALIIATKRGQYKNSAVILLSLAQAYGHFKQYISALKVLSRTEIKMGRETGRFKANVYKTYAEYARLLYLSQRSRNPLNAQKRLLDQAISKWRLLKALSGAGSSDGQLATRKIKEIEKLK